VVYFIFFISNWHVIIFLQWVDSENMIYPHIVYEELSKAETFDQVAVMAVVNNCTVEGLC
jgi:hypothetical protein